MKNNNTESYLLEQYPTRGNKEIIVCVMTGSDGGIKWSRYIAKRFNEAGFSACALAYWNYKNLPKMLSSIPVEIVETAVITLKKQGYKKVCLYGVSKGAELSLLSASLFDNIDGVIAVSPSCAVFEGFSAIGYNGHSSWTYQGKELPFISISENKINPINMHLGKFGYAFRKRFEIAFERGFSEDNRIKIENAKCPVLLISASDDSIWQAAEMGDIIIKKLDDILYKYPYKHLVYDTASHVLAPSKGLINKVFIQERKHPKECEKSRRKAFDAAVDWVGW